MQVLSQKVTRIDSKLKIHQLSSAWVLLAPTVSEISICSSVYKSGLR